MPRRAHTIAIALGLLSVSMVAACKREAQPPERRTTTARRVAPAAPKKAPAALDFPAHGAAGGLQVAAGGGLVVAARAALGTIVRIGIRPADAAERRACRASLRAAFAELDRLEALLSSWRAGSDTSRLNRAAGAGPVPISAELAAVLAAGQRAAALSAGAFDLTFSPLSRLWKIGGAPHPPPSSSAIAVARARVDHRGLVLEAGRRRARLRRGQRIDLGGIGKGYIVDRLAARLRRRHGAFYLQAGGDLYFAGRRGKRRWRAGIRDPRGPAGSYFAVAELSDETFSTSGDYERYHLYRGRRYHHIIDPRTGHPARASRSVTILAASATEADWLSTAVFILGPRRGMALVERQPKVEAVIVGADGSLHVSSGMRSRLSILRPPIASHP